MGHAERILVIDEYAPSRVAVTNALVHRGHACAPATTAEDAVAIAGTFRPSIVLIEWAFRDGSGVGLASRLRASCADGRLVVIALSHANPPEDAHEFDDYLVKPAGVDEIESAFLRQTRMMRAG